MPSGTRHVSDSGANLRSCFHTAVTASLLAMGDKALAAVERALNDGDARIALDVLKGLELLKVPPIGPDDRQAGG